MTAIFKKTFIALLLTALPAIATAEMINGIAAIVNNDIITTYDVDNEKALLAKESGKKGGPAIDNAQLRAIALNQLIDKKLAEQKIGELGIKVTEDELRLAIEDVKKQNHLTQEALVSALQAQGLSLEQYKSQLRDQIERSRLLGQEIRAKIQVGEPEIKAYYQANSQRFSEETFQARHIYFAVNEKMSAADVDRVKAAAASVLEEARSGKDFGQLAQKYSDDKATAKEGGELGTFKKGEIVPEIELTVEKMKEGEISNLVVTPAGFHIINLEKRITKNVKTFDEAKAEIEDLLYRKKSEEKFNQWMADLRKGAAIEIKQ